MMKSPRQHFFFSIVCSTSTVKTSMCTTYLSSYCIVLLYMCLVYSPLAAKYRISSFMTMSQALKVSKKKSRVGIAHVLPL